MTTDQKEPGRDESYILSTGEAGAARLAILGRVLQPTTEAFLSRAGLQPGMRTLDLGCGGGDVTRLIAGVVGDAEVVGVDRDPLVIAIAADHPVDAGTRRRPRFQVGTAEDLPQVGDFDFVYARFLLTHLSDPRTVLRSLVAACAPGAIIAVEDIDFSAHVCDPPSSAFDRFVELYQQAARAHGADPCIGPSLPDLFRSVGLVDVESTALVPRFTEGEGKLVAYLTFVQIQPSLVALGLADQSELLAISTELRRLGDDGWSMMSLAGIVQASGRIPAR
ncbi:MAG TPA: methyltransferase domain-containing protein [Acidimicrobiales bacterium]|jgi:SAM-dependent methyltransferase|nr:methyltransferase domain-containing protein [Acidimicrobiales bacterium]